MRCPQCGAQRVAVLDSRPYDGNRVWRRRGCLACDHRFTTYEVVAEELRVIDREGPVAKFLLTCTPEQYQAIMTLIRMMTK